MSKDRENRGKEPEKDEVARLLEEAGARERRGRLQEAIAAYEAAMAVEERPEILQHIGNLKNTVGDLDGAEAVFRRSIELLPTLPGGHYGLGLTCYRSARVPDAIRCFEKTIELDPEWLTARYWLGLAHYHRGDLDEAIRVFRELLDVCPGFTIAHYHLGLAASQLGLHDETIRSFGKVLEKNPRSCLAHYQIGVAQFRKGNLDDALAAFRAASEINPEDRRSRENLRALEEMRARFS